MAELQAELEKQDSAKKDEPSGVELDKKNKNEVGTVVDEPSSKKQRVAGSDSVDSEVSVSTVVSGAEKASAPIEATPPTGAPLLSTTNQDAITTAMSLPNNVPVQVAVQNPNPIVNANPTTPQGVNLGLNLVTTNLVVPEIITRTSREVILNLQNQLAGIIVTLPTPGQRSVPPLMSHETIVTINGPFSLVHAAYVQLVQLAFGHIISAVKIIVGNDEASVLIGKQGTTIRDIRLGLGGASNCIKILERDPNFPTQRLVTFTGDMVLVLKAHELVQDLLVGFSNKEYVSVTSAASTGPDGQLKSPNGELTTQVQVPNESLGAVIGRGGARIQEVRTLSGAKVTIDPPAEQSPFRLVTITGTNEGVEWAKYLISVSMSGGEPSQSLGTSVPPGMVQAAKQQAPQYSAADLQAAGYTPDQISAFLASQSQAAAAAQQPGFTMMASGGMKLTIPNEGVGSIIGKGGCKINHMRHLSGAKINVLEPVIGSAVRSVTIEGDSYAISKGQLMLTMAQAGVDVSTWQPGDLQQAMQQQGLATQPMGYQGGMNPVGGGGYGQPQAYPQPYGQAPPHQPVYGQYGQAPQQGYGGAYGAPPRRY